MLFGHQNDDTNSPPAAAADPSAAVNPLAVDPATGASLPVAPGDSGSVLNQSSAPAQADDGLPPPPPAGSDTSADSGSSDSSVEPTMPFMSNPAPMSLPEVSSGDSSADDATSTATDAAPEAASDEPADDTSSGNPSDTSDDSSGTTSDAPAGDLLGLKQQALTQLSPLISQLDQTPEEKFRTVMMLIQSSDNQTLIPNAYEAAQTIPDEKVRAQALLDVINEINYFTQKDAN